MKPLPRITAATIDVLRVLTAPEQPSWGLLIIKASQRPAGSVYPILERLESLGWVTSSWDSDDERSGPRRRYYVLTEEGGHAASTAIAEFDRRATTQPHSAAATATPHASRPTTRPVAPRAAAGRAAAPRAITPRPIALRWALA